jgi:hypothetical protein
MLTVKFRIKVKKFGVYFVWQIYRFFERSISDVPRRGAFLAVRGGATTAGPPVHWGRAQPTQSDRPVCPGHGACSRLKEMEKLNIKN